MSIVQWQGVYPAILTPFKKDDSIDFEMYQINMKAQLDAGIDGIVLGGSLGEASKRTGAGEGSGDHEYCRAIYKSGDGRGQ
jgi:dihydrodipicolinate synthase/N-acetylneuraminate lyase